MTEKIKYYFDKGLYQIRHIEAFVTAKVLSREEADRILGVA